MSVKDFRANLYTDQSSRRPYMDTTGGCVNCSRPVSYANYVQCNQYDSWWHFQCAGVTESAAERSWTCHECLPVSVHTKSTNRSARIALKLQRLEEERAIQQRILEAESRAIERDRKLMQEKYHLLEGHLEKAMDNSGNRSRVSQRVSMQNVRPWVHHHSAESAVGGARVGETTTGEAPTVETPAVGPSKVRELSNMVQGSHASRMKQNTVQQRQRSNPLADQPHLERSQQQYTCAIPETGPNVRERLVDGHLRHLQGIPTPSAPPILPPGKPTTFPIIPKKVTTQSSGTYYQDMLAQMGAISPVLNDTRPVQHIGTEPALQGQPSSTVPLFTPLGENGNQTAPQANIDPNVNGLHSNMPYAIPTPRVPESGPSPSQLVSRQIMPRELPLFAGNPADWPIFISAFVNTTAACGYSSVENLIRLQRCLKGGAYEAGRSCLMLPESVPQVINTLQLLYGRPKMLINILLDEVWSTPAPEAERLEILIEFGLGVQSLCDHLEAAGQPSHLRNPCLLQELVEKLPAHVKMEWANFMQRFPEVNVKTFGDFMNGVVISACRLTQYTGRFGKSGHADRSEVNSKGSINTHVCNPKQPNVDEIQCWVCKGGGHHVRDCSFQALSIDNRWKTAQTNELCRSCLNAHGRHSCRYASQCTINGCTFRHHLLLHSNHNNQPSRDIATPNIEVTENPTHRQRDQPLLFRIVPIKLYGPKETVKTYAFLDDGSSLSLVEEELGVDGSTTPLCLTWRGKVSSIEEDSKKLDLELSSSADGKRLNLEDVRTVKKLALPEQTLLINGLVHQVPHLRGLPISGYEKAVPRLLIGINNLRLTVPLKVKEGHINEPVALKTRRGWCVFGGNGELSSHTINIHASKCDRDMYELVKDDITLEDISVKLMTELMSSDDGRNHNILEQTTERVADKNYTGSLRIYDDIDFSDSYELGLRKWKFAKRRIEKYSSWKKDLYRHTEDPEWNIYGEAKITGYLKQREFRQAEMTLIGMMQQQDYSANMEMLSRYRARPRTEQEGVAKNGALCPMMLIVDETRMDGFWTDGRIRAVEHVWTETRLPVIPSNQHRRHWARKMQPMVYRRANWCGAEKMVATGELLLIVKDGKRNSWMRGRLMDVVPEADSRNRQGFVRTARGLLPELETKLAILMVKLGPVASVTGGRMLPLDALPQGGILRCGLS